LLQSAADKKLPETVGKLQSLPGPVLGPRALPSQSGSAAPIQVCVDSSYWMP
jgi:hypothetical protein